MGKTKTKKATPVPRSNAFWAFMYACLALQVILILVAVGGAGAFIFYARFADFHPWWALVLLTVSVILGTTAITHADCLAHLISEQERAGHDVWFPRKVSTILSRIFDSIQFP